MTAYTLDPRLIKKSLTFCSDFTFTRLMIQPDLVTKLLKSTNVDLTLKKQLTSCTRSPKSNWRVLDSTCWNSQATHPSVEREETHVRATLVLRHFTRESRRFWGWSGMLIPINLWSASMRLLHWQGISSLLSEISSVWWAMQTKVSVVEWSVFWGEILSSGQQSIFWGKILSSWKQSIFWGKILSAVRKLTECSFSVSMSR